jgi:hypothetical protein
MRGVRPVDPRNDCIDLYHSPTIYAPVCAAVVLCRGFGKCKIFGGWEGVMTVPWFQCYRKNSEQVWRTLE